jgi:hypothetical protein
MGLHKSRRRRTRRLRSLFLVAASAGIALPSAESRASAIYADQVSAYVPGTANASFQNAQAALGPIIGDTTFGGLNPFNPPFASSHIVIVGEGGSLTLRLASPFTVTGGQSPTLGVFVNNGLVDVSADGSGLVGSPPTTFSALPRAIVSVSATPLGPFVPLNGGSAITFESPTNAYLDTAITNYFQPLGTQLADQSKPFTGHLSDFAGETYAQVRTTLNGSAGGTWLDLSGTALPAVQYVRFDVPTGAGYRMVVDSVAAVPEPGAMAILVLGSFAMLRRRRSVV